MAYSHRANSANRIASSLTTLVDTTTALAAIRADGKYAELYDVDSETGCIEQTSTLVAHLITYSARPSVLAPAQQPRSISWLTMLGHTSGGGGQSKDPIRSPRRPQHRAEGRMLMDVRELEGRGGSIISSDVSDTALTW